MRSEENAPRRWLVPPGDFGPVQAAWAREIEATLEGPGAWAVVGIKRRGAVLARRLREDLGLEARGVEHGELDISLYRDDYHLKDDQPRVLGTELDFPVDDLSILLVDDVLFTGRTVRAAMDLLLDFGRPRRVWLAVLVDRGHRELPIAADITGVCARTERADRVMVRLPELGDSESGVELVSGGPKR